MSESTETVELEADLQELFQKLDALPIGRAAKLVKAMEVRWGVSAKGGGGVMMAAGPAAGAPAAEEKTTFDVFLKEQGANKIQVIKVVRELTALGLKEAKALVDAVPGTPGKLKEGATKDEADEIKKKVEEVGGVIEIK